MARTKAEVSTEVVKEKESIELLVELINKEFGKNSIFNPKKTMPVFEVDRISTGNLYLDMDLGGGLADGKIHLITGPFSSGKTFLALKVAAQYTRRGLKVAFIDAEFTFDPSWAEACGVNMELVYVIRKQVQEEVIDIVELLVASGDFALIILDSLAALLPQDIKDDPADKQHMGKEAKLNNKMFKKVLAKQSETALNEKLVATLIVINQWRQKVGLVFGNPNTLPGGQGQYYYCSTWVDFWADETILDGKEKVIGMKFGYNIRKNKTAPPRRTGKTAMFLETYKGMSKGDWDSIGAVIDVGVLSGVIQKAGSWYAGPVLGKSLQFTKLWSEIYNDAGLEGKIVSAIQKVMPEISFKYTPPVRRIKEVISDGDSGSDSEENGGKYEEGEKSKTGT